MKLQIFLTTCLLLSPTGCGTSTPKVEENYVHCRSLVGDRTAVKLLEWEFNALSDALKSTCSVNDEVAAVEIQERVMAAMKPELRDSLQDPESSIETTLLEMEVRGVFARIEKETEKDEIRFRRVM
jgi:hypothetical protein